MAAWGTLFDASWWVTTKIYGIGYWVVWGTPETREMKAVREANERLVAMEKKVEQMWAIQTHMSEIDTTDPHLMDSIVLVEENGDVEIFPSGAHNPQADTSDPFEEGEISSTIE